MVCGVVGNHCYVGHEGVLYRVCDRHTHDVIDLAEAGSLAAAISLRPGRSAILCKAAELLGMQPIALH